MRLLAPVLPDLDRIEDVDIFDDVEPDRRCDEDEEDDDDGEDDADGRAEPIGVPVERRDPFNSARDDDDDDDAVLFDIDANLESVLIGYFFTFAVKCVGMTV